MKIYCQYSYGGYRIFHLSQDSVDEVTVTNRYDIPQSVISYLSYSGMKLILTYLADGYVMLQINDIQVKELDDIGRNKSMSYVFIANDGNAAARLRLLAMSVLSDYEKTTSLLTSFLTIDSDGLNFDENGLNDFLDELKSCSFDEDSLLYSKIVKDTASIFVYNGSTFESSASVYGNLISSSLRRNAVKLHWNEDSTTIDTPPYNKFIEFINRILQKLKIWKN